MRKRRTVNHATPLAVSIEEVQQMTNLGQYSIMAARKSGELPAVVVGRRVLFRVRDVEQFLATRMEAGSAS
jgi:excisionase family DNA binding protein